MTYREKIESYLLYGGISREDYLRVKGPVAHSNHVSLLYWSVLVCVFWLYCLLMSLRAEDYLKCRPAYVIALSGSIVTYLCTRLLVWRFPKTLPAIMGFFRLTLLGGGIGIAVCQPDVRAITLFCIGIISPSIFIDNTLSSLAAHLLGLILYIALGRNTIAPEIYSWGLGNYILFSIFGILIGNAINRERFERYVFEDSAKKLVELQTKYAYFDQMTGLRNRRAYEERRTEITANMPEELCIVMADLDGLKKTNDTLGHMAGDELITAAAACLSGVFGALGTVYRIGGDEFCVIMEKPQEEAERGVERLNAMAADWKGDYINGFTISCGVESNRELTDIEAITQEADRKLYEVKRRYYEKTDCSRRKD